MQNFIQYLIESDISEANAIGSNFEQQTADCMQKWLKENGLNGRFTAERFQKIHEDEFKLGKIDRDESYSDIIVHDLNDSSDFFVECKKDLHDNIAGSFFRINKQLEVVPTVGRMKSKTDVTENKYLNQLASDIMSSDGYAEFKHFLSQKQFNGIVPAEMMFSDQQPDDMILEELVGKYNQLVDSKKVIGQKIPNKLREKTKKTMAVALLWRLHDTNCTWDICDVPEIPYFSDLIRCHYLKSKMLPAYYLQIADNLFMLDHEQNPLSIDCDELPDTVGNFQLRFAPRIGTGAMYIVPRTSVLDELHSDCSFLSERKWPDIQK